MPFKSEAQRRYLWANEPEIARDWTDTYGSKIHAALGGIMRLAQGGRIGYEWGGPGGKSPGHSQGPGPGGQGARGQATQNPGVTGPTGPNRGDHHGPINTMLGAPPGLTTSRTHTPQTKGFLGRVGTNIKDYIMGGGLIGMGIRGLSDVFGGTTPSTGNVGPAGLTNAGTYGTVQDAINASRRNENPIDRGGDGPYIPPYLNDVYAQNILGDEELDIDTSTGNMEDWSQRFRVDDQYRQDKQGQLDPQIVEMINNLYT